MYRKNRSWDFNLMTGRLEEYDYDLQKYVFRMYLTVRNKEAAVREYKKEEFKRDYCESCK